MKRFYALLLLCVLIVSVCPLACAEPTNEYFFNDTYESGLPDGYSGSGVWDYTEKTCVINGTGSATTEMDRTFTAKGEEVFLTATFELSGTQNMQIRFYDGSTMFQQMHLNPNSSAISVRQATGYTQVCPNPKKYLAGITYTLEIAVNIEKNTGKMRLTDNNGEWGEWQAIPIIAKISKITKWNWIYGGVSEGSKTTIKHLAAWQVVDVLTDEEAVEYVKNTLLIGNLSNITGDVSLPEKGAQNTEITWKSNSPYISDAGKYTAPEKSEGDVTAELTALIKRGGAQAEKTFTLYLNGEKTAAALLDKENINIGNLTAVYENLVLPTMGSNGSVISWESSNPEVIEVNGTIHRQAENTAVSLTATVTNGDVSVLREFNANVIKIDAEEKASNEKITESDLFNGVLSSAYRLQNCKILNNALFLYRADETEKVSLSKQFDPKMGHIAFVEMDFALQGNTNKIIQVELLGSSETTSGNVDILSAQLRIGKGFSLKCGSSSEYEKLGESTMTAGERNVIRFEVNTYKHTVSTYLNGERIDENRSISTNAADISKLVFPEVSDGSPSGILIYRLESGYRKNYGEMLAADAEKIEIPTETVENITVPTSGKKYNSSIEWSSNSEAAKYENGKFYITRPLCTEKDANVTITARLKNEGAEETKTFNVTVPKEKSTEEALNKAESELSEALVENTNENLNYVTEDLNLPKELSDGVSVVWTSSDESVISTNGKVERRFFEGESKTVTLKAEIIKNGEKREKTFTAVVINPGYDSIIKGNVLTSSSIKGTSLAAYAVDGDEKTSWQPQNGDKAPYIQADLGKAEWINRANIVLSGEAKYTLKYGLSESRLQTVAEGDCGEVVFSPVKARYVRLEISGNSTERGVSEFEICKLYNNELCVTLDALSINFENKKDVTENLTLPVLNGEYGSIAEWFSDDESVISSDGTVTRPKNDKTVTLTAKITKGDAIKNITYTVEVLGTGNSSGGSSGGGSYVGSQRPSGGGSMAATPTVQKNNETVFGDLPAEHWAKTAVSALVNKNVINGDVDGLFYPNRCVTRAEFAKMLYKALNIPVGDASFCDVLEDAWYKEAVCALAKSGIVLGYDDGGFHPDEKITREQMAVLIDRAAEYAKISFEEKNTVSFADEGSIADYAKESVNGLAKAGVINGMDDNMFMPHSNAVRAQAAQVIYELLKCGGKI